MKLICPWRVRRAALALCVLSCLTALRTGANPQGGTVSRGTATFTTQGSQLTIQTSDRAHINWSSFNIDLGETTSFIQPSSSSVVWNQINDPNPSQILGNLNANGYIVLQNQSGFVVGGQAAIAAHGVIMTTAPLRTPDLTGGGPWQFDAPPPSAKIINYGQINADAGGSVFLIAHDIENHGTISANQGKLGLYAGKDVLISPRPDGRGLTARVTMPEGSIDNSGQLIADAGTIALHAQVVNQGGLIQANSVREVNGVIELVASESLNLGPGSILSAHGDAASPDPSPGGFVVVKSDQTFADTPTSTINVSGAAGGRNGLLEIFGNGVSAATLQSQINSLSAADFLAAGGLLLINPQNITLSSDPSTPSSSDPNLSVSEFSGFSKIDLFASGNLNLTAGLSLSASQDPDAMLNLSAGDSITLNSASPALPAAIIAGNNWNVSLSAGPANAVAKPASGQGIYLNGNSYIQAQNGSITLRAANEVIVNPGPDYPLLGTGPVGNNGIRTLAGGSINVTAEYGDVNTGGNYQGFVFGQRAAPYYRVSQTLGGISTAAGGDVTIWAGGDVTSFLPRQNDYNHAQFDGGSGAFGPGNVTITAQGNVYGHYVLANGVGTITAGAGDSAHGDLGVPFGGAQSKGFALSLIKGSWNIYAPHGSIYLQDVRNPNGVFDDRGGTVDAFAGYHRFDYDPRASLLLQAANSVEITGAGAPHDAPSAPGSTVPMLFPPTLQVSAGSGGFVLDTDVILFPSPFGDLRITTTDHGNFQSYQEDPQNLVVHQLAMSDSAARQWDPSLASSSFGGFLNNAVSAAPPELNNLNPVEISVDGAINNVNLRATKAAHISVAGDMFNSSFLGENLHSDDLTSISVGGKVSYPPLYSFTPLGQPIVGADPFRRSLWDSIFYLLVDPDRTARTDVPANATPQQLADYAIALRRFPGPGLNTYDPSANPGFVYDAATRQLGYRFQMSQTVRSALEGPLEIIKLDGQGRPIIQRGQAGLGEDPNKYYFATTTVNFVSPSVIENLYQESLNSTRGQVAPGFQVGGPGQFTVNAASMDLGSSHGIISWGIGNATQSGGLDYAGLIGLTSAGAGVNVHVTGDLKMLTSTVASIFGGDVNVNAGGALALSQGNFALIPPDAGAVCYGIFTSGHSDVNVTAEGDINVGGARIATFNGGDVFVKSEHGSVNAGNGANSTLTVPVIFLDPVTHLLTSGTIGSGTRGDPKPYGSGILAIAPTARWQTAGGNRLPGNITVWTPQGNIVSTLGGIQQFALNGSIAGGPTITLTAGTAPSGGSPGYPGNVDLGLGGVVGGAINITAQGDIKGLIVSRQNSTINAAQSFSGTLLAGGSANISAGAGGISGTVIGIGGVSASSGGAVTAALLGQNVSVGGAEAQSTLGTTAAATATSQAAAQQANAETQQQVSKSTGEEDDQKKKGQKPALVRRVGRVTVILPQRS